MSRTSTVQAVERAFAILDLVAAGSSSLADITAQVHLPKSTVARMLTTMEALKAVVRHDDGSYAIGPRVADLVGVQEGWAHLRTVVQPHLERLAEQLGEATGFAVPDGLSVRNVSQVESPTPVQVRDYTGLVVPAHVGSPGLAMMASWGDDQIDAYLERPLESYTSHTVTDPAIIRERVAQVRETGWALVVDEFADGITSIAATVVDDTGRVVGTLHAHGPTYRFPPEGMADEIGRLVATTARSMLARR